jgi:hypothetical protein
MSCLHCCNKIAEAEAAVSVNKKKWLVMHMNVQLKLYLLAILLPTLLAPACASSAMYVLCATKQMPVACRRPEG